ncbi:hypothetical protein pb186bvf_010929 [Paramecium bursaria]
MQKKIFEAQSYQGYLQKKSPSKLKFNRFQKRYFMIRSQGQFLIYYPSKPQSSELQPKGVIPILDVKNVTAVPGTKTDFLIVMQEREFYLKAETPALREKWIEILLVLKEALSHNVSHVRSSTKQEWHQVDAQTKQSIKIEEEQEYLKKHQQSDDILKSKGLYHYLNKFNQDILEKFVFCGFVLKKGKLQKITSAKKRWVLLIGSVPLTGEQSKLKGPEQQDIPDTFSLDTLYYFAYDQKGDKSNYKGKVPVDDITDVEMMDTQKSKFMEFMKTQKVQYGMTFRHKERQHHFFMDHLTDVSKLIQAIKSIQSRVKQQQIQIKEEYIYEEVCDKKSQKKVMTGPLSWYKIKLYLKKDSLGWVYKDQEDGGNQYILLIDIKKLNKVKDQLHIHLTDGTIHKLRMINNESTDKWIEQINKQHDTTTEELDIDTQVETSNQQVDQKDQEEPLEEDIVLKMALSFRKESSFQQLDKKQSFWLRMFNCCNGETDDGRGF